MGGSRKKAFIDKKNAVTYALMARPEAEEGDDSNPERGTQMWMRKDDNHHVRDALADAGGVDDGSVFDDSATETASAYSGYSNLSSMSNVTWIMTPDGPMPRRERLSREKKRELRELGFDPNDGYDYTRHLRTVGEGGGVVFVPTRKDHVRGILGADDADSIGGPSGKRGNDSEQVFLREDVERDGDAAVAITDDRVRPEEADAEQRWTHERVKAVTDERVYAAKNDASSGLLNAVVAKQTRAPSSGTAKIELERMIEKMEEFELAQDDALPALDEFRDGGLGDLQDDFILQAMLGGDEPYPRARPQSSFPPIRLRYDDAEVDNALATVEEMVEEDLLEEEEEGLASGAAFGGGGNPKMRGPGSDAGTDRDLDEDEWAEQRAADLGAEARDVDTLFEAMARGYDSDEIGELDEDDPRIFGRAELDRFGSVLEAFRSERRPEQYRTAAETAMGGANADEFDRRGRELRKRDDDALFEDDGLDDVDMRRAKPLLDDVDEDGIERSKPAVPRITRDDVHDAFRAMVATRRRAGLDIPTRLMRQMGLDDEGDDGEENVPHDERERQTKETKDDDLPAASSRTPSRRFELEDDDDRRGEPDGEEIEYLRNAPRESWDCETIVSTYSNLENHPSVIDEPHGGSGSGSGRGKRRGGAAAAAAANGPGASLIRLSQTNGLPVDYVHSRRGKGRGGSLLTAANLAAIGEDGDGDERFADDGSDEEEEDVGEEWRSNIRRKGETPEEKKARKAAVKAGRRDARAAKKGLKTTFKQEEREMGKKAMVGDVRPGLSVTQLG